MRVSEGRWRSSTAESRSAQSAGNRHGCCTSVLHHFDRQSRPTVKVTLTSEGWRPLACKLPARYRLPSFTCGFDFPPSGSIDRGPMPLWSTLMVNRRLRPVSPPLRSGCRGRRCRRPRCSQGLGGLGLVDFGQSRCRLKAGVGVEGVVGPMLRKALAAWVSSTSASLAAASKRVSGSNASSATMLRKATAPRAGLSSASLSAASKRSANLPSTCMAVSAFLRRWSPCPLSIDGRSAVCRARAM